MIIDGRALAETVVASIATTVSSLPVAPILTVFTCAPNFETQKFLALKERRAKDAGIILRRVSLPDTVTLAEVEVAVVAAVAESDGIIIQFPFPHLQTSDLIPLIPASHDVDVLRYDGTLLALLPPVVGAIDTIAQAEGIDWAGKRVVVVGNGRLVGAPTVMYATARGAIVTLITKDAPQADALAAADIVVLGAGVPGLLAPHMVKDGVMVFDAGTSEEGGVLVGDADPAVAMKAALFTPVPGGVGPLTVAVLLKNVLYLAQNRGRNSDSVV